MMGQALPAVTCLIVLPFAHMRRQTPQALPKSEGGLTHRKRRSIPSRKLALAKMDRKASVKTPETIDPDPDHEDVIVAWPSIGVRYPVE